MAEEKLDGVSETTREAMRVKDFTFDFSFWTVDRDDPETYCDQEKVRMLIFIALIMLY
jgi:hypothetical protein